MIDLSSYPKFKQDSEQSHVTIYPLVIIDNQYYISTVKESIKDSNNVLSFKDYNLKISNIKESTDIENHNFKISNVTLNLNNYEIDGQRLSDVLVLKTNKDVEIYYKTQSCEYLSDCLPVYKGSLRKIDHDDSNVKITLEDLTQSRFHKDVPIANIGFSDTILNKDYQNKPIPITYGYVDKAPAIPYKESSGFLGDTNIYIISDDISDVTGNSRSIEIVGFGLSENEFYLEDCKMLEDNTNPLYIHKGDYYRVLEECDNSFSEGDYSTYQQYKIDESLNFIKIEKEFEGQTPKNPPAFNEFQTVKVRIPTEFEQLGLDSTDSSGYIYDDIGEGHPLLNLNYPVYGTENSLISPESPSRTNEVNPFSSFTEIPNSQMVDALEEQELLVSQFCNYTIHDWEYPGIHYPISSTLAAGTNFHALVNAWVSCNAHSLDVKFIEMPPADMIRKRASEKLQEDGHILETAEDPLGAMGTCNIRYQNSITPAMKESWRQASWFDGTETSTGTYVTGAGSGNMASYVDVNYNWYNANYNYAHYRGTTNHVVDDNDLDNNDFLCNPKVLYDGTFKNDGEPKTVYPSLMWKFQYSGEQYVGNSAIYYCLVGQKNDSMDGNALSFHSSSNEEIVNFYNLFNDGTDTPYLFELDEFAVFDPKTLVFKDNFGRDRNIGCKFNAEWNGVPIGIYPYDGYKSHSCVTSEYFNGAYPGSYYKTGLTSYLRSIDIGTFNATSGNYGGNWVMMVGSDIEDPLSNLYNDSGSLGEYTNNSIKAVIKKGTLLPSKTLVRARTGSGCDTKYTGYQLGYEYITPDNPNYFTVSPIVSGTYGTAEQRTTSLLTFPSLDIEDEIETRTFVYGKVLIDFPGNSEETTTNVDSNSRFLFGVGATDVSDGELDFTAELPINGVNIIDIQESDNNTLTNGGLVNWSSQKNDDLLDAENVYVDKEIFDWASPNEYNAISLTSRAFSTNPSLEHYISAKAQIYNIGILQYITFENIFNSEFYVDTIGRADLPEDFIIDSNNNITSKYTNQEANEISSKIIIENPADIIYHFAEKELGYNDIIDVDNWIKSRDSHSDYKFAFSVKETINSKKLIEDLSKNTSLYPKFTYDGKLGFDFIKPYYGDSDVNSIITPKDVLSISFSRTPIENINTLVNVKYKKDYAEDEYTRETGYCDCYDFFGNGDGFEQGTLLQEAFDASVGLENGYRYSYYELKRDDKILEFESDYIRDKITALKLRDYLLMQNANQHNIVSCTLTLRSINLETGDIIKFSELINGLKCYGEDYSKEPYLRNGQYIYPYFMITSITKSSKNIKITAIQLHNLNHSGSGNTVGDLSRLGGESRNYEDANILNKYILGQYPYITTNQLQQADSLFPYSGNVIDYNDLNVLLAMIGVDYEIGFDDLGNEFVEYTAPPDEEIEFPTQSVGEYRYEYDADGNIVVDSDGNPVYTSDLIGDTNQDAIINVVDIVAIVGFILGGDSDINLDLADTNQDGIVNVVDIVAIVGEILS